MPPRCRPGERRVVLVVDDEADLLEIVTDRLTGAGYEVVTARDGLEALAPPGRPGPRCIILDLKMPRLSAASTPCRRSGGRRPRPA